MLHLADPVGARYTYHFEEWPRGAAPQLLNSFGLSSSTTLLGMIIFRYVLAWQPQTYSAYTIVRETQSKHFSVPMFTSSFNGPNCQSAADSKECVHVQSCNSRRSFG